MASRPSRNALSSMVLNPNDTRTDGTRKTASVFSDTNNDSDDSESLNSLSTPGSPLPHAPAHWLDADELSDLQNRGILSSVAATTTTPVKPAKRRRQEPPRSSVTKEKNARMTRGRQKTLPSTSTELMANTKRPSARPASTAEIIDLTEDVTGTARTTTLEPSKSPAVGGRPVAASSKRDIDDDRVGLSSDSVAETPYYCRNFLTIVTETVNNEHYAKLLSSEELELMSTFNELSESAKCLFVRLMLRKDGWIGTGLIKYSEIGNETEIQRLISDLVGAKLLLCANEEMGRLLASNDYPKAFAVFQDILNGCSEQVTYSMCHELGLKAGLKGGLAHRVQVILTSLRQRPLDSFFGATNAKPKRLRTYFESMKKLTGSGSYRVDNCVRRLFRRCLLLSLLSVLDFGPDDLIKTVSFHIYQMLESERGVTHFVGVKANCVIDLFPNRAVLDAFAFYFDSLSRACALSAKKKHREALDVIEVSLANVDVAKTTCGDESRAVALPSFLRRFTPGYVKCKLLRQKCEVLAKLRDYANELATVEALLEQETFVQSSRGRLIQRQVLLCRRVERRSDVAALQERAFLDERLPMSDRLHFFTRWLGAPRSSAQHLAEVYSDRARWQNVMDFPKRLPPLLGQWLSTTLDQFEKTYKTLTNKVHCSIPNVHDQFPKRTFHGHNLRARHAVGRQNLFVLPCGLDADDQISADHESADDGFEIAAVELVAIDSYKKTLTNWKAVHGEGSPFWTVCALLFWEQIFDNQVPNVFLCVRQSSPLDFHSDDFWCSRSAKLRRRLAELEQMGRPQLRDEICRSWISHKDMAAPGLNWNCFASATDCATFAGAFGGRRLSQIFRRYLSNPRLYASGFPDLALWCDAEGTESDGHLIAEVKGPNDRLSERQQLWMAYLLDCGLNTELCSVVA